MDAVDAEGDDQPMVPVRLIIPVLLVSLFLWPFVFVNMLVSGDEIDGNTVAWAVVIIPAWFVGEGWAINRFRHEGFSGFRR
jgi:hypothetical protein